jgi:hypothetical protein
VGSGKGRSRRAAAATASLSAASSQSGLGAPEVAAALGLAPRADERVKLNDERIAVVADHVREMSVEAPKPEAWDVPLFWLGENSSPEERSQYYTIGNAINFRFWEIGEDNELIVPTIRILASSAPSDSKI